MSLINHSRWWHIQWGNAIQNNMFNLQGTLAIKVNLGDIWGRPFNCAIAGDQLVQGTLIPNNACSSTGNVKQNCSERGTTLEKTAPMWWGKQVQTHIKSQNHQSDLFSREILQGSLKRVTRNFWICRNPHFYSWTPQVFVSTPLLSYIPSGKHTKSYWKWPFIVDFPIKDGDFQ